jgi:hypothetical protein
VSAGDKKKQVSGDYVQKHLLKGRFVKAVMKPGSKKKGTIEGDELWEWRQHLKKEHYTNEEFASQIHYEMPVADPVPPSPVHGRKGSLSPPERSFIYLDVGAWIGSKDGKWGKDDSKKPGSYIKRDFGIVCGPLVMLCSFTYAHIKEDCAFWKKNKNSKKEPFQSVAKLIEALSKPALADDNGDLGAVVVREALVSPSASEWFEDDEKYVIHVILGDMHVPVLDGIAQTYGNAKIYRGPVKKTPTGGDEVEVRYPDHVDRLGRVDIRPLQGVIKALAGSDDTKLLDQVIKLALTRVKNFRAATNTYDGKATFGEQTAGSGEFLMALEVATSPPALAAIVGAVGAGAATGAVASWKTGDWEGTDKDRMSPADAEAWFEYYRNGVDGGKPADIFEKAGDHFLHFMGRLATYQNTFLQNQDDMLGARFVQLGDMLDFWVGFTCHYNPSSDPDQPVTLRDLTARKMLQEWTKNLFGKTEQGKHVASAVNLAKQFQLAPVFLYGNHDNYLGARERLEYPFPNSALSFRELGTVQLDPTSPRYLEQRRAHFEWPGLYMEHGHQWEPSNTDSKGTLPVLSTLTLGTPSPMGMFVTQAAFIRPGPIRAFEGQAAGLVAEATGTYGQRLDQIIGAATRFFLSGNGFYCYVMGHTHSACISTVIVSSQHGGTKLDDFRKKYDSDPSLAVSIKGARAGDIKLVNNDYGPADVTVEWVNMLGSASGEWVYLRHEGTPEPNDFKNAIKGLALPNDKGSSGSATFSQVPPGLYRAQYYLTRAATQPFRRSGGQILIEGIGIEGDPTHEAGTTFEHKGEAGFARKIFLRWAFDEGRFYELAPYFEICRAEEATEKPLPPGAGHYAARFSQVGGENAYHGRLELGALRGGKSWNLNDKHGNPAGTWVVRAFSSIDHKRLGAATFVVKAHASKAKR